MSVQGTVPLWTFGKITNLVDAARAQVRLKEYTVTKVRNEVRLTVRKAYYGAMLARDALSLVAEAIATLDKHIRKLERAVDEDDADEVPLFKMRMHRADLAAKQSEALQQQRTALSGLRLLVGARHAVSVVDEPLTAPRHALGPLSRYLTAARLHRPEVNMARVGVMARQAQLRSRKAAYYPNLGLTMSGAWSQAPEITDQLNPFVRDQANYLRYGAALGLTWKLDFLPQVARTAQARAKLEEMRALEEFALGGIAVEVEVAHGKVQSMRTRFLAYQEAVEYARRWLITVQQGLDIGAYDPEDVIAPAKEYAMKRFSLMSAIYGYRVALAELALATGWEAIDAPSTAVAEH